jgi:hypothetical protein
LLLAEVAACLHNIGKLSEEFILYQAGLASYSSFRYQYIVGIIADWWASNQTGLSVDSRNALQSAGPAGSEAQTQSLLTFAQKDWLRNTIINLPSPLNDRAYTLGDFIELQASNWYETHHRSGNPLPYGRRVDIVFPSGSIATSLLEESHHAASGVEKEDSDHSGEQNMLPFYSATVFGYEKKIESHELSNKRNAIFDKLTKQHRIKTLRELMIASVGDTRRPINEVALWDISSAVAAFYKAVAAKSILDKACPTRRNFEWRVLRVAVDGLDFYSRALRLPDLLIRRKLFHAALDNVSRLLEEDFPLGNEVYRDELGSAFIVPALDGDDDNGTKLKQLIEGRIKCEFENGAIGGEAVPHLIVSKPHSQGLTLAEALKEDAPLFQDQKQVESWWQRSADICPVCGLRPQGPSNKSLQRKVCDVCEQRREDRSIEWAKNLNTTIWIDEVADINSRLALVVGQLAIDDWLKPDGMIKTLLVKPLTAGSTAATKNVSFARLQRVWETTRLFWEDVASSMDKQVGKVSPRLRIEAEYRSSSQESGTLGVSHSYEIKVENQRLSIVCVKAGEFLTAENLHYLAKLLNAPEEDQKDYSAAAVFVHDTLLRKGEFEIEEPTGYGSPNKLRGKLKINKVTPQATPYVPAITILAEPRNFMALVPADKALNVVEDIKAKYEIEMGKVRNRLPLTVGAVFAGSRTPLAALLDAGRRMLKFKAGEKKWKIANARDDSFKTGIDDAGNEIRTSSRKLDLESDDPIPQKLTWHVPNKMGDGTTPDDWYPYFFTDAALDTTRRMFQSPDGSRQLIHVGDLKNDGTDEVIVQPSTFDFEFLDSAAQRFEISYKDGKRRGWERRARPYYLEEVEDFQKLWAMLSEGLATSQIKTLGELIETKRREWRDSEAQISADVFEQFVKDAINNAAWKKGKRPKGDDFTSIVQAAVRGQLADVIELYTQILKQKSKVDRKDTL